MRKRRKAHVYLRELLHNNNAHKISTMALCRNSLLRSVNVAAFCSPQQPHHRHLFSFLPEEGSTIRSRVGTVRPLSTFLHSPAASLFESNNKYNYKYRPTGVITMASSDFSTGSTPDLGSNILSSAIPFMWSGLTIFVGLVAVMGGLLVSTCCVQ